jgi:23S rRNA (adenine2030-N6)-methyltransferase
VLLDPSYEVKDEYRRVAALTADAHRRWTNAIYAIWYPLLPASRHLELLAELKRSGLGNILLSELTVAEPAAEGGMYGSGMAIVNPPWQSDDALDLALPPVVQVLAPDTGRASLRWAGG